MTAADPLNARSTITVTIKVTNVDEMPELEGPASVKYPENGTGQVATFTAVDPEGKSIVWSLATGGDAAAFTIIDGVLRFESPPDFEGVGADNTYDVTVQASDGGVDTTASKAVTIDVTNVDEPGTVTLSTLQPQLGEEVTATLADPDNVTDTTISWQWYRGTRAITGATSTGALTTTYTPVPGDGGSRLRATVTYNDGEGTDKTAQADSSRSIRNAPSTNTAPLFPGLEEQARKVAENMPAGTNLGAAFTASDSGDVLTYSLSGSNAALFSINRATGQLSTKTKLNYEDTAFSGDRVLDVIVTATDPFGEFDMVTVMVTLTDVNEAPTLTAGDASIDRAENVDTLTVASYTATDADAADPDTDLDWVVDGR